MDIANWLRALGLERYEATFRENDVTAQLLPRLTSDDLKDLGITSVGHRRQLQDAIAALRLEETPTGDPQISAAPASHLDGALRRDHRRTSPAHRDVLRSGGFDCAK